MNKQEAIEKIEGSLMYENTRHIGKAVNIDDVIDIINQIYEPEKPIVPQYVADMIIERKKLKQGIVTAIRNLSVYEEAFAWVRKNQETFAKAWLYGYRVKKEKLYTAKLKSTGEYMHLDRDYKDFYHIRVSRDIAQTCKHYHFTRIELMERRAWENDAYEVEEVKE